MTSESEQSGDAGRKFDAVASLFGSIVPPPGATLRPVRQFRPLQVPLPNPSPADIVPQASAIHPPVVAAEPDDTMNLVAEPSPAAVAETTAPAKPRPREIPWPDAFEPRPNYRKPKPRNGSWMLVVPLGIAVAIGFSLLDTRALKLWIDTNLLHLTPISADTNSPLMPAPFRNRVTGDPVQAPPDTPDPVDLTPAIPTSPVAIPPGTETSPPPVDPVEAAAAAAAAPPMHVTIQYRRGIPGADGEARRLAALLQNTGGSVELRPNASTVRTPTIIFHNPIDKHSATMLAGTLANEVATWTVHQGTGNYPPGSIDIWMP